LRSFRFFLSNVLPTVILLTSATFVVAQSSQPSATPSSSPTTAQSSATTATSMGAPVQVTPNNPNAVLMPSDNGAAQVATPIMKRIERARALAAAHQLEQAAMDLENVRASVNDVALRNVTSLMLVGVYLEEGNYGRAQALLEESFAARAAQKDESLRTYFAMAGQTINGIRAHLARYRSFGLNPGDVDLPSEANTDLDRVRGLLERVAAQAKEISNEAGRSYDAVALQEDVVGIRLSLATTNDDHEKWQTEYVAVRERLASSPAQTATLGRSNLLDAVTARIPNPFVAKPAADTPTDGNTDPVAPITKANSTAAVPAPPPNPVAATTSAEKTEPQLISTGSLNGRESKRVTPAYPTIAKTAGVSGTVRVFAIIDENGKVWVTNSEGPTLLRRAAEEAAKNWSFPPTLVSGRPVRVAGYLDFDFKL
jgi:TonB family protein